MKNNILTQICECRDKKIKIKNLETYHEDDNWYLAAVFTIEFEDKIYELNIPKIKISSIDDIILISTKDEDISCDNSYYDIKIYT